MLMIPEMCVFWLHYCILDVRLTVVRNCMLVKKIFEEVTLVQRKNGENQVSSTNTAEDICGPRF